MFLEWCCSSVLQFVMKLVLDEHKSEDFEKSFISILMTNMFHVDWCASQTPTRKLGEHCKCVLGVGDKAAMQSLGSCCCRGEKVGDSTYRSQLWLLRCVKSPMATTIRFPKSRNKKIVMGIYSKVCNQEWEVAFDQSDQIWFWGLCCCLLPLPCPLIGLCFPGWWVASPPLWETLLYMNTFSVPGDPELNFLKFFTKICRKLGEKQAGMFLFNRNCYEK